MSGENSRKEVKSMSRMKPIQATPELSGEDARRIIEQVNRPADPEALKWNEFLKNVLEDILEE